MKKIIHLEQHIKEKENKRRLRIYDAESARVHLIYQKKYKIDIETTDLFRKFIGEKKTYFEFLEALPKLEPRILYYVVVTYHICWHICYKETLNLYNVFAPLKLFYKQYYSQVEYKRIFFHICIPKLVKNGVKVNQQELFERKTCLRVVR